jgi:hypothetical protein
MATIDIPLPDALTEAMAAPRCVDLRLPKPNLPSLTLPTGGSISAIADVTRGIPSDCSMNISLALQIAPIMASMECLLKVLKFVGVLVDVFTSAASAPPTLPVKLIEAIPKLADAGKELAPCIGMAVGLTIPAFIKDLLLMIAKMLRCALSALKSAIELLDGLELEIASAAQNGNDALAAQLECAKENGMTAADGAMRAIDPVVTLLQLASPFLAIMPGAPTIQMPALASDGSLDSLKTVVTTLEQVALTIEGIAEAIPL